MKTQDTQDRAGMGQVYYATLPTGDAKKEGREPSHDGEFLGIYYLAGSAHYIVTNSGGVGYTSLSEEFAFPEDLTPEQEAEIREEIEAVRAIVAAGWGVPATAMGDQAADIARSWGWSVPK